MTDDRPAPFARVVAAAPAAPCAAAVGLLVYLCPIVLLAVAVVVPVAVGYFLPLRRPSTHTPPQKSVYPTNSSWTDDDLEQFAKSSLDPDPDFDDFADEYLGRVKRPELQVILDLSEVDPDIDLSDIDLTTKPSQTQPGRAR